MPTVLSTGTADLVLNTPMTIYTSSANKHYAGFINFDEMDTGDTTILLVKTKVLSGDSFATYYPQTFTGPDGGLDSPVFLIPITGCPYGIEIILQQTAGTVRDYKWQFNEP